MSKYFKKGAMFGLDARIALAIFGALSVISGAALYSAIQDSKVTAIITEAKEVVKAWEQYMLDTGHDLPLDSSDASNRQRVSAELISSADTNWKGPYLQAELSSDTDRLASKYGGKISLTAVSKTAWGLGHANTTWAQDVCNDSTKPCYMAVQLSDGGNGEINFNTASAIDSKIDNGDGASSGTFRWYTISGTNVLVFIGPPFKMPQ